jgi:hypothetical protein
VKEVIEKSGKANMDEAFLHFAEEDMA